MKTTLVIADWNGFFIPAFVGLPMVAVGLIFLSIAVVIWFRTKRGGDKTGIKIFAGLGFSLLGLAGLVVFLGHRYGP